MIRPPTRACRECGDLGHRLGELCHRCAEGSPSVLNRGAWVIDLQRRILVWEKA